MRRIHRGIRHVTNNRFRRALATHDHSRRVLVAAAFVALASSAIVFASLPATDSFTRADAGTLGANWTDQVAGLAIAANRAQASGNFQATYSYWNADAFSNDQYAQATVAVTATGAHHGVMVRASSTNNHYVFIRNGGGTGSNLLRKRVAGSVTTIQTISSTINVGDVMKLQVIGTTLKCFVNGAQVGTDQTDSDLTSGSAGIYMNDQGNTIAMDDFQADNLGGGCVPTMLLLGVGRCGP